MTIRPDGRRVISVTMQTEMHQHLISRCRELDQPITVFVREAIKRALQQGAREGPPPCARTRP